jgi:hypothetical protein
MSGYGGEARSRKCENVQIKLQQNKFKEIPSYPKPLLDEVRREHHNETY